MNNYSFDELKEGHKESFAAIVTEEYVKAFRQYSGDENPLHKDAQYAREKGFSDKVVFGMLTASYYSTLVGVYLPGERCLIQELNIKFNGPVYVGDVLNISGEVLEKNDLFQLLTVKAEIKNQNGKTVSKAKIILKVR